MAANKRVILCKGEMTKSCHNYSLQISKSFPNRAAEHLFLLLLRDVGFGYSRQGCN